MKLKDGEICPIHHMVYGCCGRTQPTEQETEISALKAALEKEHENFLSVHRDNMQLALRNMELKAEIQEAKDNYKKVYQSQAKICIEKHNLEVELKEARELIGECENFIKTWHEESGVADNILAKIEKWRKK